MQCSCKKCSRLRTNPISALEVLRPALKTAAQRIYDSWQQDGSGYSEDHAYGGVCHEIAGAFVEVLYEVGLDATTFSQSIGPVHVYAVANVSGEAYRIDIDPYTYERGYGYEWKKIPDVVFEDSDIIIESMGYPFDDYIDESNRRRNPDRRIRGLQRKFAAGDVTVLPALRAARVRLGLCPGCGQRTPPPDHEHCLKCMPYTFTWDTLEILENQIKYLVSEQGMSQEEAAAAAEADQELYSHTWEWIEQQVSDIIDKMGVDQWCVEYRRRKEGIGASNASELFNNILPRGEHSFNLIFDGEEFRMSLSHHDAPTGTSIRISPAFECETCSAPYCSQSEAEKCHGTLVVVDVQPEYESAFTFDVEAFCKYVDNHDFPERLVLFNGEFTLNMISEGDLRDYYGRHGARHLQWHAPYHDKGYAFFRSCMDEGFADDVIVPVVKYMWDNNISDSRDIDWDEVRVPLDAAVVEFLQSEEMISIPDLMDVLDEQTGHIHLVGGGVDECLREVVIALKALDRSYSVDKTFTY